MLALVKGIEYGCLGLAIAWVSRRSWGGIAAHAAVGLAVGILFGGAILSLDYASAPDTFLGAGLLSKALNEILFPVGCSLVLFSAGVVGEKVTRGNPE